MEKTCENVKTTTDLEKTRSGLDEINERIKETNKRLKAKLVYLRGDVPESDDKGKEMVEYGFLKETNRIVGYALNNSSETSSLLDELFTLI